ncbi:MAG: M28 family peptidase [Gemmataceae bacterium]|nr:M28 family peptidase [Gemmataceae bacterium]
MSRRNRVVVMSVGALLLGGGLIALAVDGFFLSRPAVGEEQQSRPQFAQDRAGGKEQKPAAFDSKRAMGYLEAVCSIGPRMSGTPGMRKQIALIRKHFEDRGVKVEEQTFKAKQVSRENPVEMTNLIVSFHPDRKRRVILCCHYDTRPIADQEKDPRKWRERFVSANDGGSGVAFLMELGHHMKDIKTQVGVDFVFFDGEEYIWDSKRDEYFFGSKHFAQTWRKMKPRPDYSAAVLLDMIAGKNARFPVEGYSWQKARAVVQEVWGVARELRSPMFLDQPGEYVLDDHTALHGAGIAAIDIIDFSYPHWHRLSDTPQNCSAESLAEVARVLTTWLQRTK